MTTLPPDASSAPPAGNDNRDVIEWLDSLCAGENQDEVLTMGRLLADLRERGFGMFLFISVLPGFIPIPGAAGVVSGPLSILIGLQLILGLNQPLVPKFVAKRGPKRSTLKRFGNRIAPWLDRLNRMTRHRLEALVYSRPAKAFSGLLIVLLGLLFALPIPFTNYLFAVLLLMFAFTFLERDGGLTLTAWIASTITILGFALLSSGLSDLIGHWLAKLR
ncbi:MAG: exopolysaccharide biosynthesis protein [Xanthomonadaceae bacterium]|jgi:hypothetical protein|nr:exopolysaccharide biosynthesis protein [Xanthomonadaceae bacterium]